MDRNIVPDSPSIEVPYLSYEDARRLNCLTAYNASKLRKRSRQCGCFHCGSRFLTSDISEWMSEEDGEDTALCPCCGSDAVVFGMANCSLPTSLLSKLYLTWFESEHRKRRDAATDVPSYLGEDDYLRKGVPFLTDSHANEEIVDEVELSEVRSLGHLTGVFRCYNNSYRDKRLIWGEVGGTIKMALTQEPQRVQRPEGPADISGFLELRTDRGRLLLREPYREDTNGYLVKLIKQYGPGLRGVIVAPRDKTMRLVVKRQENGSATTAGSVGGGERRWSGR